MQVVLDGVPPNIADPVLPDGVLISVVYIGGKYRWKAVKYADMNELLHMGSTEDFLTAACAAFASVCVDKPK